MFNKDAFDGNTNYSTAVTYLDFSTAHGTELPNASCVTAHMYRTYITQ